MQRMLVCAVLSAVSIPASSLWAASPILTTSAQYASQIAYEASRVQAAADGLQSYVRSGAEGRSARVFAHDMNSSAKRLASLVDQAAAQPGINGDARAQADKMKAEAAGLKAMVAGTTTEVKEGKFAAHADAIFADTTNIENRSNTLRIAAQSLSGTN